MRGQRPTASLLAAPPVSDSYEQDVAGADSDTLPGLGGGEVFHGEVGSGFEPGQAVQSRDVQQHAASHDAVPGQVE